MSAPGFETGVACGHIRRDMAVLLLALTNYSQYTGEKKTGCWLPGRSALEAPLCG